MRTISLGIGSPASIGGFILFGLSGAPIPDAEYVIQVRGEASTVQIRPDVTTITVRPDAGVEIR